MQKCKSLWLRLLAFIFFCCMLYPAEETWQPNIKTPRSRSHCNSSAPQFPPNSGGIVCWMAELTRLTALPEARNDNIKYLFSSSGNWILNLSRLQSPICAHAPWLALSDVYFYIQYSLPVRSNNNNFSLSGRRRLRLSDIWQNSPGSSPHGWGPGAAECQGVARVQARCGTTRRFCGTRM